MGEILSHFDHVGFLTKIRRKDIGFLTKKSMVHIGLLTKDSLYPQQIGSFERQNSNLPIALLRGEKLKLITPKDLIMVH